MRVCEIHPPGADGGDEPVLAADQVFAVPAAVAGYHVVFAVSQIGAPSLAWREVFACLGAVCIGVTSWMRLMVLVETRPFEPGGLVENSS